MEPVNKDQYLLQSLDNALGVLSLFLQEDKLTLSQIAQRVIGRRVGNDC